MALRLPRIRREIPLIEENKSPSLSFQQWLDIAFKQIEKSVADIEFALGVAGIALGLSVTVQTRGVTSNYTVVAEDYLVLVDATSSAVTVTLPVAANSVGKVVAVKKTDATANTVTVDANGAETIDGAANVSLPVQYNKVTLICDGTTWWVT